MAYFTLIFFTERRDVGMKKIVVTGACGLVISALIVVFGLSSERDPGKISQAQPLMQDERNDTNSPFFETQIYRLAGDKMNVPLTDVDEGLVSFEERLRVITQRRPRKIIIVMIF